MGLACLELSSPDNWNFDYHVMVQTRTHCQPKKCTLGALCAMIAGPIAFHFTKVVQLIGSVATCKT